MVTAPPSTARKARTRGPFVRSGADRQRAVCAATKGRQNGLKVPIGFQFRRPERPSLTGIVRAVAKRSYGTGRLYVVVDRGWRASWYGSWWAASTRVKRKVGLKRTTGNADGLTRAQAERELRRLVDATTVVANG